MTTAATRAPGWLPSAVRTLARAGALGLLAALPVAGAVLMLAAAAHPILLALGALALAGSWALVRCARVVGVDGVWIGGVVLLILAGHLSSISFGGQHGRLLWCDGGIAIGTLVALMRGGFALEIPLAPFLDRLWPFLAWSTFGMLLASDPLSSASELKEWFAAAAVGIAAACYASDARRSRYLLAVIAVLGAVMGAEMFQVAMHAKLGALFAIVMKQVDLEWGKTNYLAGILIVSIPVTLGLIGNARRWYERLAWCVGLLLNALGLVLTTSKGGIAALAIALTVSYGFGRGVSRVPRLILLGIAGVVVALYVAGPLSGVMVYRMQQSALDYSVSERVLLYRLAWDQFLKHPIVGLGPDNFEVASSHLHGLDTVPHNFELGYLAEGGLVGLGLALVWVFALGLTAWKATRLARTGGERSLAIGLWAAFVAFVVHSQVESTIYGQQYKMVLIVWAAATWGLTRAWSAASARPSGTRPPLDEGCDVPRDGVGDAAA